MHSVLKWKKKYGGDFSASEEIVTGLEAGSPAAVSFFKFQAFTTAVVQDSRIRARMGEAIAENLATGKGEKEFHKVVNDTFDQAGYSRLKPYQIENIYVTNTSLAYGAGQMAGMAQISSEFPYWRYSATLDSRTRPEHAKLHGKIFKNGDFTFWPPLSFRCRCSAIPITARQAGKYAPEAFPDTEGKKDLFNEIPNKSFAGNKQMNYLNYLAKEYKAADKYTQTLVDKTVEKMTDVQEYLAEWLAYYKQTGGKDIPKPLLKILKKWAEGTGN